MATDRGHIEALRSRLFNKIKGKEAEIAEIRALYDSPAQAPKILEGKFNLEPVKQEQLVKTRPLAKRNVTELVRKYIEDFDRDTVIAIPDLVKWLWTVASKAKNGPFIVPSMSYSKRRPLRIQSCITLKALGSTRALCQLRLISYPAPS